MNKSTVPVLLYHAVTSTPGDLIAPYTVTPEAFGEQLDLLLGEGYTCLTFSALLDALAAGTAGEKVAAITFDDGYADFAEHALPALQARGLTSTMYLTTGFMEGGKPSLKTPGPTDKMLDWAQLPDLLAAGTEIGAHSHSHPQMDTLTKEALRTETHLPKQLLEQAIGNRVRSFAYPHGYNGPRVQRFTRAAGYDNAAGVRHALTHAHDDPFNVARLMVEASHSLDTIRDWLRGQNTATASSSDVFKTKGWRAYRRARAVITRRAGSDYQ